MHTVWNLFKLPQRSKIIRLTLIFPTKIRSNAICWKNRGFLFDKTEWYTIRIWIDSSRQKSGLMISYFVHSHTTCISSSFRPWQNGHEVSNPGVKRNLFTLTQDIPTLKLVMRLWRCLSWNICTLGQNFVLEVYIRETCCSTPVFCASFAQSSFFSRWKNTHRNWFSFPTPR